MRVAKIIFAEHATLGKISRLVSEATNSIAKRGVLKMAQINEIRLPSIEVAKVPADLKTSKVSSVNQPKFDQIMHDLERMERRLVAGGKIDAKELLVYQMKISRFAMGVELVAKVAEGVSATLRKLQGNQ